MASARRRAKKERIFTEALLAEEKGRGKCFLMTFRTGLAEAGLAMSGNQPFTKRRGMGFRFFVAKSR